MNIAKHLKKNNGSALTMVLFMLFMLSVMSIAVIALTSSELSMSVMSSDRSEAMQAAQAGAERAAQIIDEAVGQAQEKARGERDIVIQGKIAYYTELEVDGKTPKHPIDSTSKFFEVFDNTSSPGEIIVLDKNKLEEITNNEYKYQFYKIVKAELGNKLDDEDELKVNFLKEIADPQKDGKYMYKTVNLKSKNIVIPPGNFSGLGDTMASELGSGNDVDIVTSIEITSVGEYNSPINGSSYKREIKAEFGLLTESNNSDIPVSYSKLTTVRINKKPSILSRKALIAQKNIIAMGGTVDVTGDVISYGTIPKNSIDEIDYSVGGYEFGGIMAGVPGTKSKNANVWNNINLKKMLIIQMKSDPFFITNDKSGSFIINGNVATAAFIHTLCGSSPSNHSDITVKKGYNAFARSVNIESESNYSQVNLQNVFTFDDLKVDGNNANVKIGGWNGETADINNEGLLVGLNKGNAFDPSSAVIVAGDSKLYINGSVYVGGSSVYNDYRNSFGKAYVSGMSIQKSDSRPAAAFEQKANIHNPDNVFYAYDNSKGVYINPPIDENSITWDTTYNAGANTMMDAISGNLIDILEKAMHIKYIWDNPSNTRPNTLPWKEDVEYGAYFNTGDIIIEPSIGNQLKGFCFGGVAANNTIYDPYTGFTKGDFSGNESTDSSGNVSHYDEAVQYGKKEYAELMDLFVNNENELNMAKPPKSLSDNIEKSVFKVNTTVYRNAKDSNNFMYYSDSNDSDVVLTNSSVGDGDTVSETFAPNQGSGIIYSSRDIYVQENTNFNGILIAEGNVVFLGDANIKYDEDAIDNLIIGNQSISAFFKHKASDIVLNDKNAVIQTAKKKNVKNIKIISWKEI